MGKRLFVGGLPYSVTEDQLRELFAPYGQLDSVRIISDKYTGQSRGFGFVEMANDEEATKAMEATNGIDFNGRNIVVNEARPETPRDRPMGGAGGGGGRGGRGGFGGGGGGGRGGRGGGGGGGRGGRSERW